MKIGNIEFGFRTGYLSSESEIGKMPIEQIAETKRRIQQRQSAEMIHELALTEASEKGFKSSSLFWSKLSELIVSEIVVWPEDPDNKPPLIKMTDEESKRFGRQLIPFGEFAGTRVDDVELERLVWYSEQTFIDKLRRYLNSDRIERELKNE